MKGCDEGNGYSLVIGGAGLSDINTALAKMGFCLSFGNTPQRCLDAIRLAKPHGIILADNLTADPARQDNLTGEQRLIALLEQLQRLDPEKNLKVWLLLTKPPAEPWKTFSRFGIVQDIRRRTNPLFFAGELLTHLNNNQPPVNR